MQPPSFVSRSIFLLVNDQRTALIATISVLLLSALVLDNIWLEEEEIIREQQFTTAEEIDRLTDNEDIHYLSCDSSDLVKAISFDRQDAYDTGLLF
jgi:hypothetical protein